MASAKDNMKALIDQRDKLLIEFDALRNKIVGLEMAISILESGSPTTKVEPKSTSRRTGVKGFVLDLLKERGTGGLNAAIAVEISHKRGVLMDRGSVSSLLSRLKQDNVVTYDGHIYRLHEFSPSNLNRFVIGMEGDQAEETQEAV